MAEKPRTCIPLISDCKTRPLTDMEWFQALIQEATLGKKCVKFSLHYEKELLIKNETSGVKKTSEQMQTEFFSDGSPCGKKILRTQPTQSLKEIIDAVSIELEIKWTRRFFEEIKRPAGN